MRAFGSSLGIHCWDILTRRLVSELIIHQASQGFTIFSFLVLICERLSVNGDSPYMLLCMHGVFGRFDLAALHLRLPHLTKVCLFRLFVGVVQGRNLCLHLTVAFNTSFQDPAGDFPPPEAIE